MKLQMHNGLKSVLLSLLLTLASCSGTKNTGSSNGRSDSQAQKNARQSSIMVSPNEDRPSNLSLTDMLQRLPGVSVQGGRGAYSKFVVSGASGSFMSGSDPLFVVDGRTIGTDYSAVYTLVNPKEVTSLRVLKGPDTSIYGTRGGNGVIVIRTK